MKPYLSTLIMLMPLSALAHPAPCPQPDPVGLSLFFRNGIMAPITLAGDAPRYLQEVDLLDEVTTTTDEGLAPLIESSNLDWSGVEVVEETWAPNLDGTFTRNRFYRNARWMDRSSLFVLFPMNDDSDVVGAPIFALAGKDDLWRGSDDGFVRRFVARQIASRCPAVGDCAGSPFTAQSLVQLRDAMHASQRAHSIPQGATQLSLFWSEDPLQARSVYAEHAAASDFAYGYGLEISLEEVSSPANGQYYLPGDTVSFRVVLRDQDGNRLHPEGSLPTFGQFLRGEVESGLHYVDFSVPTSLFYSLKHRESNVNASLSGPTNKLKQSSLTVNIFDFLGPQVTSASVATDGYSSIATTVPSGAVIFLTGLIPGIEDSPVSDIFSLTIPADALPGTYVAAFKMRRDWGGEALNRAETVDLQVGSATATAFTPSTGKCNTCHSGASSLGEILHGTNDRRACFSCHASLNIESDNALDIRVHTVHDRSDRFPANINNCSVCHLTTPSGPGRGILNLPN